MSATAGIPATVVLPAIVPATAEIVGSFSEIHEKLSKWGIPFKKDNKEYNCPFKSYQFFVFLNIRSLMIENLIVQV
jgi:hypothetical protein